MLILFLAAIGGEEYVIYSIRGIAPSFKHDRALAT